MDIQQYLKNKSLLFVVPETWPSYAGGGRNAFYFASYLSKYSNQTKILSLNYNGNLLPKETKSGVIIHRLVYYNYNLFTKILSFIVLIPKYFKFIVNSKIIFVYSGYLVGWQLIILFARLLKRKIIFRSSLLDGDDILTLTSSGNIFKRYVSRFALRQIDIYFSINKEFTSRAHSLKHPGYKIFDSLQGVNSKRFEVTQKKEKQLFRKKLSIPNTRLVLLTAGFMIKRKGFLEMIRELAKSSSDFLLIALGEINSSVYHKLSECEVKEVQEAVIIAREKLGRKVRFEGAVERIEDYYKAADLLIQPSKQEGTPNVILEAMATGLPVLTYKLAGIGDSILQDGENCLIFNQYADIPRLIEQISLNPGKLKDIGQDAAKTIHENYTFEIVSRRLIAVLNNGQTYSD